MKNKLRIAALLVVAVAIGALAGVYFDRPAQAGPTPLKAAYVCPMHPDVTSAKPADCSKCGMALVSRDGKKSGSAHDGCSSGATESAGGCCSKKQAAPGAMTLPPGHPPVPGYTNAVE